MPPQFVLKLAVPQEKVQRLLAHRLLRAPGKRQSEPLFSIYYDTRRLDLHRAHLLLRLRKAGDDWLQTVSPRQRWRAGLAQRGHWESPYRGHFDFAAVEDKKLRARLQQARIKDRLEPIFEIRWRRLTCLLEPATDVAILLIFDRGWIAAGGRRAALAELELELLAGDSSDLYALAAQFTERLALLPESISRAERGYRLYLNTPAAPVGAERVSLDAAASPLEALRTIALDCLTHLQDNHAGAIAGADPEYVHQMRVATRRLRAALRLFAPVLGETFAAALLPQLRGLMATLGRSRDLHVLMSEIVGPVAAALPDEPRLTDLAGIIAERLYQAHQEAAQALRQPDYGRLLLLAGALLQGAAQGPGAAVTAAPTLAQFADGRLRRLRRRVLHLASRVGDDDPDARHALRKSVKRLRYALEFFAALLPRKALKVVLHDLAQLQNELGQLNDLSNAGSALTQIAGHQAQLREAVTLIGGWHAPRYAGLLAGLPRHLRRLARLSLPRPRNGATLTP